MTDLRVLVVDDEPLACEMVAELVRADPDVASVICCADATEAAQALAHDRPDIAFLDVEMPETNGIAVAAGLPDDGPVTVFITAFSQYAPQAFDVRAIDYVLKPFSDERFREALDRAKRRVRDRRRLERADRTGVTAADSPPAPPARLERLTLGTRDRSVVVRIADVIWIEAQDYYACVHSGHGRHLVRATLTSLEGRLDPARFLRVHRGAIVNLDAVTDIDEQQGMRVKVTGGTFIPVSRNRRRKVRAALTPTLRAR
jgi:two-component system LytT family response regulator